MNRQENGYQPLIDAISLRRSTRTFLPEPLPAEFPQKIADFFDQLTVPFAHQTTMQIFEATPGRKLYNNGIHPVNNLAFTSQTDLLSISKTGFVGQLVMLYATSMGLDTCWFGHYKLAELGRYLPGIATPDRVKAATFGYGYGRQVDVGERVICCMPFGRKKEDSRRLVDLVAKRYLSKRKPLADLLEKPDLVHSLPSNVREALELAKLAPSAANSQMWRFGLADGGRTITVAKPAGYRHPKWEHPDTDIGMCAAQLWLGLLAQGESPQVEVKLDADRAFWTFTLG